MPILLHAKDCLAQGASQWYAAYIRSRHEKRVADQLEQRGVEHFLPLYETIHRWKDRDVCVHLPLFPGYIFLRLHLENRLRILQIRSVVRLVGVNNCPTPVDEKEIEALRNGLSSAIYAEPYPYIAVGQRVRVKRGPLDGVYGVLMRKKNKVRFIVSIDLIRRSVSVEIDIADLELVA